MPGVAMPSAKHRGKVVFSPNFDIDKLAVITNMSVIQVSLLLFNVYQSN